jgi:uncharacterized RDD family membrane protein YckC
MEHSPQDTRYAPPQARLDDVEDRAGELARRGRRLGAAVIDVIATNAALWAVARLTPIDALHHPAMSLWTPRLEGAAIGFLLMLLLQGFLLATRGQTIGKAILKIRIRRPDGSPVSAARLIGLRYGVTTLAGVIPAIMMVYALVDQLMIFRESRRCLHDVIADTVVVRC